MCAAYPYHVPAEDVAELLASDNGDPEYLVRMRCSVQGPAGGVSGLAHSCHED